ncbi:MAG TPA: DHA2 family efflux MFS transporter permease subunit [Baekduia sp.]|nr:DHA2 family efflux MFS transporter permease subunit [Baekduia sp.]
MTDHTMTDKTKRNSRWTFAIVSAAVFMAMLDNLVVMMALPSIQKSLGGSIESLEWTVNAYTLAFAVFLLIGAALGDRFGRRRMFIGGLSLFTISSAAAAIAPSLETLVVARATQGLGAAVLLPLTLTLLSESVTPERRGAAIGAWSGISGLGIALGPIVGGVVVQGISWHWIFWLNVPLGIVLVPLAIAKLQESYGPSRKLDLPGVALVGFGLLGLVHGIVRANALGWTDPVIVGSITAGVLLLIAFVIQELRTSDPMLPMRLFRSRSFSATNAASFALNFGLFGSTFLIAQTFQVAQGYTPVEAGVRTLPWTMMPLLVAPLAGLAAQRIGPRPLIAGGLAMQSVALYWLSEVMTPTVGYGSLVLPFIVAGVGMSLVFAPAAYGVLASVRAHEEGQASGALNAIREVGGVLGVAVLASVFAANGSYVAPQSFIDGVNAAMPVGAAVLAAGAVIGLLIPSKRKLDAAHAAKGADVSAARAEAAAPSPA